MRRVLNFSHGSRAAAGVAGHRRVHGRPAVLAARPAIAIAGGRRLPTRGRHRRIRQRRRRGESAPADDAFDASVVEESVNRARGAGSRALLVMYRGRLAVERYFVADDATSLLPAALVARPLAAMAVGSRSPTAALPRSTAPSRATCPNGTTKRAAASPSGSSSRKPAGWKPAATSAACCIARPGAILRTCRRSRPPGACACC